MRIFANNTEYYSLCVHGCNHLSNEFGVDNYKELSTLSSIALWRMEQHKMLTGLPYDPVFVFPQGRFSTVAMKALKDQGYFAAFNSTLQATDSEESPTIEYPQPATRKYHDFPLFLRRYPKDRSYFTQDINLDRPIVIVEHHGAFRNGYKPMTDLIDWVNGLGDIRWTSLLHIAEHYLGDKAPTTRKVANSSPLPLRSNAEVVLRRFLSEARDNYIERSSFLNKVYNLVRR